MHKSLIEHAIDYLYKQTNPQTIDTIFDNVKKLSNMSDDEFTKNKSQFYTDFTLCSNFVFCGNGWDLKERQPEALFDADSSFFIDPKERKKIQEKKKKEKLKKVETSDEDVNLDSVSGYEDVDVYNEYDDTDDSYDDSNDTFDDDYNRSEESSFDDLYDDEDDDDDDEDYENLIGKYEDLYDED